MYSQNNEEQIILSYFGDKLGHLLSLGENDGQTLSNSRALIEKGWSADLVEPAPRAFEKLQKLYTIPEDKFSEDYPAINLINVAIGPKAGKLPFYESGTLFNGGDTDLVSTLSPNETRRWDGVVDFKTIEVDVITFQQLLESCLQKTFDFISIDCEGCDYDIFTSMDLNKLECKMVCVEFNGKNEFMFNSYARQFGMRLAHKNAENLIYVR